MKFKSFHWLSHQSTSAIIPFSTNMVSVRVIFWDVFNFFNFLYFGGVFIKTIISLALDGCELIIANKHGWNNC